MNQQLLFCSVLLAALGLTACGSDGGDDAPPPVIQPPEAVTEVPSSAAASPAAYVSYAAGLAATEVAEPLGLDKVAEAPLSETTEPADL
ncbi:hypothetical protein [Roseateles sp.]|uniref:hypothetical protein n=1 Tax=Roseateles sp. TaxID=1971397 RepID=UPI00286C2064|nr:hypothetical protein [Roseateles sp.]